MITAEVAVYPLKTENASNTINSAIHALQSKNVQYSVNSMNTHLTGFKEDIFTSLQEMFSEAELSGNEINMVVTITNALD